MGQQAVSQVPPRDPAGREAIVRSGWRMARKRGNGSSERKRECNIEAEYTPLKGARRLSAGHVPISVVKQRRCGMLLTEAVPAARERPDLHCGNTQRLIPSLGCCGPASTKSQSRVQCSCLPIRRALQERNTPRHHLTCNSGLSMKRDGDFLHGREQRTLIISKWLALERLERLHC